MSVTVNTAELLAKLSELIRLLGALGTSSEPNEKPTLIPTTPEYLTLAPHLLRKEHFSQPDQQVHLWNKFGPFLNRYFNKFSVDPSAELVEHAVTQFPQSIILFTKYLESTYQSETIPSFLQHETVINFTEIPRWVTLMNNKRARPCMSHNKFKNTVESFGLDFAKLNQILKETDAAISGSSVLHALQPLSLSNKWTPTDIDIYVRCIPERVNKFIAFLKSFTYRISKIHQNYNGGRSKTITQLMKTVYEFSNASSQKIQLMVMNPDQSPYFHISKMFDIPQVKNYYSNNLQFDIAFNPAPLSESYTGMWFDLAAYQLREFTQSEFPQYLNEIEDEINFNIERERVRMEKYAGRGYPNLISEFEEIVERFYESKNKI